MASCRKNINELFGQPSILAFGNIILKWGLFVLPTAVEQINTKLWLKTTIFFFCCYLSWFWGWLTSTRPVSLRGSHRTTVRKLQETVKDREAWRAIVYGVTKSWTQLGHWKIATKWLALEPSIYKSSSQSGKIWTTRARTGGLTQHLHLCQCYVSVKYDFKSTCLWQTPKRVVFRSRVRMSPSHQLSLISTAADGSCWALSIRAHGEARGLWTPRVCEEYLRVSTWQKATNFQLMA